MSDLEGKKKYIVNMNITVCLEPSGSCIFTWDILKNVYLPKLGCDWNMNMTGKYLYMGYSEGCLFTLTWM